MDKNQQLVPLSSLLLLKNINKESANSNYRKFAASQKLG